MPEKKELRVLTLTDMLEEDPSKAIQDMIQASEHAMLERKAMWDRYWKKYRRGLSYRPKKDMREIPLFFTNYIFSTVEAGRVYLTRSMPSIVATPVEVSDDLAAQVATVILQHTLKKAKVMNAARRVLQQGFIKGLGWFKVYFDPDADKGKGAVVIDPVPPEDMLVDPLATSHNDARWLIHRKRNVPLEEALEYIKDNDDIDVESIQGSVTPLRPSGEKHEVPGAVVTMYEAWVHTKGKWTVYTMIEDTVVSQKESPFDHGKSPFVVFFDGQDDGADNFYKIGIGEVEEIEPQQDKIDAIDYLMYKNFRNIASRQRYVDITKGIDPNTIDDTPNRVMAVVGSPREAVLWDNPPPLGQEIFAYRYQSEQYIQTITGVFEVTQGKRPVGIVAARAIESLQEAAATRLYDKQIALCDALKDVAELVLHLIFQFYDSDRILRIANNQYLRITGRFPEALAIPEDAEEAEIEEIQIQRLMWKEENGYHLVLEEIDLDYDIEVDAESTLPQARRERGMIAPDLFRLGAIDRRALLEALDWPGRAEILGRMGDGISPSAQSQQASAMNMLLEQMAQAQQPVQQQIPEAQMQQMLPL